MISARVARRLRDEFAVRLEARPDTLDEYVIEEVLKRPGYLEHLGVTGADRVLDIGANIGAFTCIAAKVARAVVGYEPEPENAAIARRHIAANRITNAELVEAAVVGRTQQSAVLYLATGKNKGNHTMIERRGRQAVAVVSVGINTIVKQKKPTKIKIDCEGSEVEILRSLRAWNGIEAMAIEFHHALLGDTDVTIFTEIKQLLRSHFLIVEARDVVTWGYSMIYARGAR